MARQPLPSQRKSAKKSSSVKLPTKPRPIPSNLTDYSWLIYGEKGIGKSTLAAELEADAIRAFFALERPVYSRELIQIPENTTERKKLDWPRIQEYVGLIAKGRKGRVVFDTMDSLVALCETFWKKKLGFSPIAANDFGKSFNQMRDDFNNTLCELLYNGFKLTFVSHARSRPRDIKGVTREELKEMVAQEMIPNETQPTCRGWGTQWMKQNVDFTAYYGWDQRDRVLHIRGGGDIYTSCIGDHFLQPKGADYAGHKLDSLPMGESPQEAYANLQRAWENKLEGFFHDMEEE